VGVVDYNVARKITECNNKVLFWGLFARYYPWAAKKIWGQSDGPLIDKSTEINTLYVILGACTQYNFDFVVVLL